MAFTVSIASQVIASGVSFSASRQYTGNAQAAIDRDFSSAPTNAVHEFAVDISELKFFSLLATADCTIKTNSSGSPAITISLTANKEWQWRHDDPNAEDLTADITVLYITSIATSFTLKGVAISQAA